MTDTLNLFAAASTWARIGAVVSAIFGLATALGLTGSATVEEAQAVVDAGQATAQAASHLFETVISFAVAAGLWTSADTARATGTKDLTIGSTVVSRAGGNG